MFAGGGGGGRGGGASPRLACGGSGGGGGVVTGGERGGGGFARRARRSERVGAERVRVARERIMRGASGKCILWFVLLEIELRFVESKMIED